MHLRLPSVGRLDPSILRGSLFAQDLPLSAPPATTADQRDLASVHRMR
jgi:hypothetical protein